MVFDRKKYSKKNKEKLLRYNRQWRKKNPEKIKVSSKKSYEKNKEKIKEKTNNYIKHNPEKVRIRQKKYRKNNPDKIKAISLRRRAIIKTHPRLTAEHLEGIRQRDGHQCIYCGSKEHPSFDYVIPITKEGTTSMNNLVVACLSCNASKNNRDVIGWCKTQNIKVPRIVKSSLKNQGVKL